MDAKYIDENICANLRREILNIKEVKNIYTFSTKYGLDIYIEFPNLLIRKNDVINEIKNEIFNFTKTK